MSDTKWWLDSNTVRGALLAGVPVLKQVLSLACLMKLGCPLIEDAEIATVVDAIVALVGAMGVVLAISTRWKSTRSPLRFSKNEAV